MRTKKSRHTLFLKVCLFVGRSRLNRIHSRRLHTIHDNVDSKLQFEAARGLIKDESDGTAVLACSRITSPFRKSSPLAMNKVL